jgi:hypothetical protein
VVHGISDCTANTSIALTAGFSTSWTKSICRPLPSLTLTTAERTTTLALAPAATIWSKFDSTVAPSMRTSKIRVPGAVVPE